MAKAHSYVITAKNNKTESEAIDFLTDADSRFILPDKDDRKKILEILGLEKSFSRAFDLVIIEGHSNREGKIEIDDPKNLTLIELKTTKKKLENNPKGFFFGATKNEFDLAERMGDRYKFCFVSLHPESKSYALLTLSELEKVIKTKRIQYQINLLS